MAAGDIEAAGRAGAGAELSKCPMGRRSLTAFLQEIRWRARRCAVQWHWNVAAQSTRALDRECSRRARTRCIAVKAFNECGSSRETRRKTDIRGLYFDPRRN